METQEKNVQEVQEELVNEVQEVSNNDTYQNVIRKLIASGCKRIGKIRIKNVNVTDKDNYVMVSLTTANPIRGYISDDKGITYKLGMTNTIFTSLWAITGAMKEDEDLSWMANTIQDTPEALNLILNGATIDVVQQEIPGGVEFTNPFTTRSNANVQVYDHDIIINHIIKFTLSKTGQRMADRMADKQMGF